MLGLLASGGLTACAQKYSEDDDLAVLTDIAGLLIPATETPGADLAGAADVALKAARVGMDGSTVAMISLVRGALDRAVGGTYLKASMPKRYAALESFDNQSYAAQPDDTHAAWRKLKALLLLGYYTSEPGASLELAYELVPGRFDPDVPVTGATRAYSSDWFGVSFR